jgi:hypothetical protein
MSVPMVPMEYTGPLPARHKLTGVIGLLTAVAVIKTPFWFWIGLIRIGRRITPRRASAHQTLMLIEGVRWAGKLWPGRCACLESSLGAYFTGVLFRKAPTWCYGAAFWPIRFHAWNEANNVPIGQVVDPAKEWPYQTFLRI